MRVALDEPPITLDVRVNPRARRIALRVDAAARAPILTTPQGVDPADAARFARRHAAWLARALAALPAPRPFREGGTIPVRGVDHALTRPSARGRAALIAGPPPTLAAPGPADAFPGRVQRALKAWARDDLEAASARHADALGVTVTAITVRDTKSRWGSCAGDGRLNYSWRLICAPPFVLDYVAAHEVAHIRARHHGPAFWRAVEALFGDPGPAERWLKVNGPSLFAVGAEV